MPTLRYFFLVLFCSAAANSWAGVTPVAITGDVVPGLPEAQYASFGNAQLNADGKVVYSAVLQTGPGDITSSSDKVLISFDNTLTLNAQTGSGNVSGAPATNYGSFKEFKISSTGDVLLKAMLAETGDITGDNNRGFWRFSNGTGNLITRTGTSSASGVPSATYYDLGAFVGMNQTGDFAFDGQLTVENGISSNNDYGVWHYEGDTGTLIVRENSPAPDVAGGLFLGFGPPALNTSNQMAFRATMKRGLGFTFANSNGIWLYNGGEGELLARNGSAEVPGSTSDYAAFDDPLMNEAGQVVFRATLVTEQQGLWLYSGNAGANLAVTNVVGIPSLPSASFSSLGNPLLVESGRVAALGTLTTGVGDVTASNDTGLWLFDESNGGQLLVREGAGGVAGIPNASFDSFEHIAAIGDTGIYLNATLQALPGGVDSTNDEGIWRISFDGSPELILRKGDSLAGRTIADLWLPAGQFDEIPLTGVSNASGELLFHAGFTNGDSGLFLYSPSTVIEFASADFDQDGDVDSADLAVWQNAYGNNPIGDTDRDGDSDGLDFLTWQRQFTGSSALDNILAVPEPSVSLLLGIAAFCITMRTDRRTLALH
jgi:hypothetical protein